MPGPLAGIIARIGAGLFGRAAAQQAGTKAAAGVAGAGTSLAQRATVLKKADQLLSRGVAAQQLGKDPLDVGLKQRVGLSEKVAAETASQKAKADKEAAENSGQLGEAMKVMLVGLIALPIAFKKLLDAVDGITSSILERQRELAPLSGRIATAFAQLELRTRRLQVARAGAVGGSTAMLADAIGDLRESLEPLRETFITGVNVLGTIAAKMAQGLAILAQWSPSIKAVAKAAQLYEDAQNAMARGPFEENWKAMLRGNFAASHPLPLGRDQGVGNEERRDAEERAGLGERENRDEQQDQAAENKRRLREIAGTA